MDLTPYIDGLQRDLAASAAPGGPDVTRAAELLGGSIEASARLVLLEALSDAAAEITARLRTATVDVQLRGREADLTVTEIGEAVEEPAAPAPAASGASRPGRTGARGRRSRSRAPTSPRAIEGAGRACRRDRGNLGQLVAGARDRRRRLGPPTDAADAATSRSWTPAHRICPGVTHH